MPKLISIVVVFYFISFQNPQAQDNYAVFDHLTIEDGLSNSLIFGLAQDSLGFIWAATQDGLNRYDGHQFEIFRKNDSVETVADSWVSCVIADEKGNIWFGTRVAGIGKVDSRTGEFYSYKEVMVKRFGEKSLDIQNLFITKDGNLMIGTWGAGLIIFNPNTEEFLQFQHDENNKNSISEDKIYSVFEDSKGNYWAGAQRSGLNKLAKGSDKFIHYDFISEDPNVVSNNFVITVEEDYKGDIWVGTYSNGLYKIIQGENKVIRYGLSHNMTGIRITKVFEDSENELWVCSNGNGIFNFQYDENRFINYKNNPFNSRSLNRDKVWSLIEDKTGLLWFGTLTNGINIYSKTKNVFNRIIHEEFKDNTILSSYIKSLMVDNRNNMWVGTPEGISIIKPSGKIEHLTINDGLSIDNVRVIYQRNNYEIWIGTWGGGVSIFNPTTKSFKYLKSEFNNPATLSDNYLKCIIEYKGKMYIGTEKALDEYEPGQKSFKHYEPIQDDSTSISGGQITNIFVDSRDNFWVGTNQGLNIFYPETGKFKRMNNIGNDDLSADKIRIREIYEDSKGIIWIGTLGSGFMSIDSSFALMGVYTIEKGLSNNTVYEILEDESGIFWISTNSGLNRFDPETENFKVYKAADGLPNDEFNGGAAFKDSDGNLFFGGVQGLTYFNPGELIVESQIPSMVFTEIKINGKALQRDGFYSGLKELNLTYDKNFIDISFAVVDYADPKEHKFKYRLEGLNKDWVHSSNNNTAVFTDLDFGSYTFTAVGANKYGIWNNDGVTLKINISPPWWLTNIALILYFLVFVSIMYGIFYLRVRRINIRQKHLEKTVSERTHDLTVSKALLEKAVNDKDKLFSIIAHDLKNPFVALLGHSEMLAKNMDSLDEHEKQETAEFLYSSSRSVYSLLENLLDWAKLQLEKTECEFEKIDISNIVEEVFSIYSVTAKIKSVELVSEIPDSTFISADINMVKAILRNFVSNAIKFCSENGEVKIRLEENENYISILIIDNGEGMDQETLLSILNYDGVQKSESGTFMESGTGLGIMLAKEFLIKNNGELDIQSKVGKGTTVKISFAKMNS